MGALSGSCLVLLWLSRQPRGAEPLPGALFDPWTSLAAALLTLWLLPGFVLWRLSGAGDPRPLHAVAYSSGLGLAWLLLPCSVVLLTASDIRALAALVTGLNIALVLVYAVVRVAGGKGPSGARVARDRGPRGVGGWRALVALAVLGVLLVVAGSSTGFTFGGDEWFLMKAARYFLEARAISDSLMFDAWDLVIALLVRVAGVDLVEAYRVGFLPFLIVLAALAYLVLAQALFQEWSVSVFAFVLQAFYCLSDMHTRGEGAGMALLARVMEDKYAALLIALPLAQAAFLDFLRTGRRALLAVGGAMGFVAVLLHPLALAWLGLSLGPMYLVGLWTGRIRARGRLLAVLTGLLGLSMALAWWLRSLRDAPYFRLHDPNWSLNAKLLEGSHKQLLLLSVEKGWYMLDPSLLGHPLVLAAILSALSLLPRFKESLAVQFLVCGIASPLVLTYNPVSATWLGACITPWMVYRVLWMMPISLTLGCALHEGLAALERRVLRRGAPHAPSALTWLLALAATAGLLGGRIERSLEALKARNRVFISDGERDLMHVMARDPRLGGRVLAPDGISIRLPSWSSRFETYPGLAAVRVGRREILDECEDFRAATAIGSAKVALLEKWDISYVVAESGSALDQALRGLAPAFTPLYNGAEFSLYAWRPERWPQAAGR